MLKCSTPVWSISLLTLIFGKNSSAILEISLSRLYFFLRRLFCIGEFLPSLYQFFILTYYFTISNWGDFVRILFQNQLFSYIGRPIDNWTVVARWYWEGCALQSYSSVSGPLWISAFGKQFHPALMKVLGSRRFNSNLSASLLVRSEHPDFFCYSLSTVTAPLTARKQAKVHLHRPPLTILMSWIWTPPLQLLLAPKWELLI